MHKLLSCALLLSAGVLGFAEDAKPDAAKKALEPLQGNWTVASIELKGMTTTAEQLPTGIVLIAGDEISANEPNFKFKFRLRLHPDTKPLALDLEADRQGQLKDVQEGICVVEGDLLKICLCGIPNLRERPAEFTTAADSNNVLFVLQRSKP